MLLIANGNFWPTAASGWIGRWCPGIGDPSLVGWLTVAAYLFTAGLCWRARRVAIREARAGARHHGRVLWTSFAIGLVALGVNKQLDLQSAITEMGRMLMHAQGWQEHQHTIQIVFIALVLLVAAAAVAWLAFLVRRDLRRVWLALVGGTCLSAFVAIRASSFHHVDRFIGLEYAGARMNQVLELGGIALITVGALAYGRIRP